MKIRIIVIAAAVATLLGFALPVLAHAGLLSSIPLAHAVLLRSPVQVEIYFSEAIEASLSSISVFDSSGVQMDEADSRVDVLDPNHLIVTVQPLPDGIYSVAWKAVSAIDGHVTAGTFPFAVGQIEADIFTDGQVSQSVTLSLAEVSARWIVFLAIATVAGGIMFWVMVWEPVFQLASAQTDLTEFVDPWRSLTLIALTVFLAASGLMFLIQTGRTGEAEIAAPWASTTAGLLFNSRFGTLWLARLALAFALIGVLSDASTRRERWFGLGLALLLLLTLSLSSNAAAQPQAILPVVADWLHLIGASIWVGGLTYSVAGLWAVRSLESPFRSRFIVSLIPRFSVLAVASASLLMLAGLYASVIHIGTFEALFNSLYGRTLLIKLAIALLMLGLGLIGLWAFAHTRQKAAETELKVRRFRNMVVSELTLAVILLLVVALLTALPPARTSATVPEIRRSAVADLLQLDLSILPGRVGVNTFALTLRSNGQPSQDVQEVLLRFRPASGKTLPTEASLILDGDGNYTLKGSYLSVPDIWQVQVAVQREGQSEVSVNFEISPTPSASPDALPWHRIAGGLLLIGALLYLFAFSTLSLTQSQLIGYGIVPALALAVISVAVFFWEPGIEPVGIINPIPPSPDSIATGKSLYTTNCMPCHGETGQGDGPIGLTFSPRPTDLAQFTGHDANSDERLWQWISDGVPETVMPAFRTALSDTERWHLVNYIRTLNRP